LRVTVLTIAVAFIGLLVALTVSDFIRNGVTGLGILAVLIIGLFTVGIVGALRNPPDQ
jgi:hypothetical protein